MIPRNAVNVPPHGPGADVTATESLDDINATDGDDNGIDDDDDDECNNIFSARPAAAKAKT